eukprot:s10_g50.t1
MSFFASRCLATERGAGSRTVCNSLALRVPTVVRPMLFTVNALHAIMLPFIVLMLGQEPLPMQRSIGSRSAMPLRPSALRWPATHGWSLLRAARFAEPLAFWHQEPSRRGAIPSTCFACSARPYRDVDLPIQQILPSVLEHCKSTSADLVLQAPTGAGKTTVVPLALLDGGMVDGKVIVLQPRRITCISVAQRMAELWGESIGETIGYRIRHEAIVSNRTRIEVVTEGVLLRLLGQNPDLEGIGCICFDEFHERSIERLAARLVIMSATFGTLAEQVSGLLGNARTIISEGRCFPVQVLYTGALRLTDWEPQGPRRFADLVATQVKTAMEDPVGDGQRPKNLVPWAHRLIDDSKVDLSKKIQVSPLYGTMETHEQDSVLKAREGWRKVILATPIAESSLTVPSVRIVVDTGLRRVKVGSFARGSSLGNPKPCFEAFSFYVFHTVHAVHSNQPLSMKFLQVFYICFAGLLFSKVASEACSERQDCIDREKSSSKALLQVSQVSQNGQVAKRDSFGMCVVRDEKCIDLFLDRNWDDGVTGNQAPELKWSDAQLVVARYDEDLRWLDALPQIPAVVYNRGEAHSVLLPRPRGNLRIIQQPNRGREDQVFLEHIVKNYDKLAQATVFLQGWPFGHCPGFLHAVRRALTFVLDPQVAGPTTAGYVQGLAPVTSTFWQYNTENGRLGLAVEMAQRHLPDELSHTAESVVREEYNRICSKLLGGKRCPSLQWVAEGAQWAVSRERIMRTPRHVYQSAMGLGEGWEGKFRGLVLEAIWPLVFGAEAWQPTQVDYLPLQAANANNRARSSDDYCELQMEPMEPYSEGSALGDDLAVSGLDPDWLERKKSRHLLFSCSQRAEYCERTMRSGEGQSQLWEIERTYFEIYDSSWILPWHMKVKLRPVLFGSSLWWPRNSPQARQHWRVVSDMGYVPVIAELNSSVQLPEQELPQEQVEWTISESRDGFVFSRINEMQEQHFLGCDGDLATTLQSPSSWQLLPMINGWSRFYNVQEQKYLSLNDRRDGGFLYCMKEIPNPDILEEAAFFIEAVPKSQRL